MYIKSAAGKGQVRLCWCLFLEREGSSSSTHHHTQIFVFVFVASAISRLEEESGNFHGILCGCIELGTATPLLSPAPRCSLLVWVFFLCFAKKSKSGHHDDDDEALDAALVPCNFFRIAASLI